MLRYPVAQYIRRHRDRLSAVSVSLPEKTKLKFAEFFPAADLDRVRLIQGGVQGGVQGDRLPIPPPPLTRTMRRLGFRFPDVSLAAAITLDHVIAARAPFTSSLLFHELVHVVQFRLLGVAGFARLYTRGFLDTGSYYQIPLERCAYELERQFRTCSSPFDVASQVEAWIAGGRF